MQYGLVQTRVIFHYLKQIVFPWGFNISYPIQTDHSVWREYTWIACAVHLAILAGAINGIYRRSFFWSAIFCFYLALVPESSFFPIPHVVFDHRMYFPFLFLGMAVYWALEGVQKFRNGAVLTGIGLLAIVPPLVALNDARNSEIDTYRKWVTSSAMKYKSDLLGNLSLLDYLWSIRAWQEGRENSSLFEKLFPNVADFHVYSALFHPSDESDQKIRQLLFSSTPLANSTKKK